MKTFDVFEIGGGLYVVVQAEHLLAMNSVVVVPLLPREDFPSLRGMTVDVEINGLPYRIRAHMPLTIEARRVRHSNRVAQLSADEGERVLNGLYTILWGL
ncbi:MAG: CcdB family protein [Pseudomonadota bacterium]